MSKYDSAWKEVIENLFEDFLQFFFPDIFADIDFSNGYEFLNKELSSIVKDNKIGRRFADELVKVFLKDGSEKWLLIHIEVQGYKENNFEERIFVYNYRIFDKYKKEVISLAILTDEDKNYRPNNYKTERWNFKCNVEFPLVKLVDYQNKIKDLENNKNPFSLVVLAHLKLIEAGKDNNKKFDSKITLIKMLLKKGFDKNRIKELLIFIDWILQLPEKLEERFEEEIEKMQEEKLMSYVTTWERRAKKEGRLEGRLEGKIEAAKILIKKGIDLETIIEATGLSKNEIEKLQQEN